MKLTQDIYPIFEANQVLSDLHLNEIVNFLDEQERLTRANLIGIGIVCGLGISLDVAGAVSKIRQTKGCGVTSQGYLIVEPQDVTLTSYRPYVLPDEPDYPAFTDSSQAGQQFDLWELFPAGEPDTTELGTPPDFLKDKAVVLFLELKKEGLRNCSPNNCDDKGARITTTIRRLLIKVDDLAKTIAAAGQLEGNLTRADLEKALLAKLNLPELRLPRYDVPNTNPATSRDVLAAFHAVFHADKLARQTGTALTAAYQAFKPLVQDAYPADPFASFAGKFAFLDDAPTTATEARFLPYYYDFFDDLLNAYDEFRWKGAELLCACCPSENLFPRHLMLGELFPNAVDQPTLYRHPFLASPALRDCVERTKDVRQLFQRLVEMVAQFSNQPRLPESTSRSVTDQQIRITPSKLGNVPLSDKAIPYYYHQEGTPPLYRLWNTEKSRRNRAHHNLSYRSDEYSPAAPAFVADALRYDLEPYNFLRIEGHLGKDYRRALGTLLSLKARHRLPIDIIALRAATFDEDISIDLTKEECRFQDLETLYATLRAELACFLCKQVQYFYALPFEKQSSVTAPAKATLPFLARCAPDVLVQPNTLGRLFEDMLAREPNPHVDTIFILNILSTQDLGQSHTIIIYLLIFISKLADQLSETLAEFDFIEFKARYGELMSVTDAIEREREQSSGTLEGTTNMLSWEELDDRLEDILYHCRLGEFEEVLDEYKRRITEVKKNYFLSSFIEKHPGIQHKAGVPIGGTFIVVYHEEPTPLKKDLDLEAVKVKTFIPTSIGKAVSSSERISAVLFRMSQKAEYAEDPEVKSLFGELTGQIPVFRRPITVVPAVDTIIKAALADLPNGTVIADFYVPYLCYSNCSPIQFVLPKTPPTFSVRIGCTNPNNQAEVTVTPAGGEPPYSYKLGEDDFTPLTGNLVLPAGPHTLVVQDSAGTASAPRSLTVAPPLAIGTETYSDDLAAKQYRVSVTVSGGTPPYQAAGGTITDASFTSAVVNSGETVTVAITDSAGCKTSKEFRHAVCDLPCAGIAQRCGYRFWIPEPEPNRPYRQYSAKVRTFIVEFPQGATVDLASEVERLLQATAENLNRDFNGVVQAWVKGVNDLISRVTRSKEWLRLSYSKSPADAVGTLSVEYFECLRFDIHIVISAQRPEVPETITMEYSPAGTVFVIGDVKTKIPAFNCIQINKCDPRRPEIPRCGKLDLALTIVKTVNRSGLTLDVQHTGADSPVAFLWEVQDGIPSVSAKKKALFTLANTDPRTKMIRLTAYTEKGCAVTKVDAIEIPNL